MALNPYITIFISKMDSNTYNIWILWRADECVHMYTHTHTRPYRNRHPHVEPPVTVGTPMLFHFNYVYQQNSAARMVTGEEKANTFLTYSIKSGPGASHCDSYQRQCYILRCYPFYLRIKKQHHFLKWMFPW